MNAPMLDKDPPQGDSSLTSDAVEGGSVREGDGRIAAAPSSEETGPGASSAGPEMAPQDSASETEDVGMGPRVGSSAKGNRSQDVSSEGMPDGPALQHVGIRLSNSCMIYRLTAKLPQQAAGREVVVALQDREEIGQVLYASALEEKVPVDPDRLFPGPIKRVLRLVTDKDLSARRWRGEREQQARKLCKENIRKLGLQMKLSRVEAQSNGGKIIFYFTAENRVDFRELVRILARKLRIRVEMRQIGVRDETRLLNGLGPCGRIFCCSSHLSNFQPVSVKMAKNQDLSLNPDAISGVCGRLMCCLGYENETYKRLRGLLPKINSQVATVDGRQGVVRGLHPLRGEVDILNPEGEKQQALLVDLLPFKAKRGEPKPGGTGVPEKPESGRKRRDGGGAERPARGPSEKTGRGQTERQGRKLSDKSGRERGDTVTAGVSPTIPMEGGKRLPDEAPPPPPATASGGEAVAEAAGRPAGEKRRRRRRSRRRRGGERSEGSGSKGGGGREEGSREGKEPS